MSSIIRRGVRIPPARLAELGPAGLQTHQTERLLCGRRVLMVGLPGAYTPVCSARHVPEFVAMADQLKASGIAEILCVAPNDPWTLESWAVEVDPERKLRFLSDGNLELGRAMGLTTVEPDQFLGERSRRFVMIVQDAVVERIAVEDSILDVTCTAAREVLLAA